MPQSEVQSEQLSQTAVEIHRSQPLSPLSVIFCGQVLTFQYFAQIKPYRSARKLFKTEILQDRSAIFFNPEICLSSAA
jgi:hypothetical protein